MSTFFEENQRYQIGLFVGRLNWDNWDSYENGTDSDCIETRFIKLTNKYFCKNLSLAEMCEREGLDVNDFLKHVVYLRARDLKNESRPV
jgi:hypothetical protein